LSKISPAKFVVNGQWIRTISALKVQEVEMSLKIFSPFADSTIKSGIASGARHLPPSIVYRLSGGSIPGDLTCDFLKGSSNSGKAVLAGKSQDQSRGA